MFNMFITSLFALTLLLSPAVYASNSATGDHIEVQLVSEYQSLSSSQQNWLGLLLKPEANWHTYWQNPGDSGEEPSIDWASNSNLSFGNIHWPIPKQIPVAHLVNYGYEGQVLLMVPVELPKQNLLNKEIEITADVSWLVCKEDCIPGWATLTLTLPIDDKRVASKAKGLFDSTRLALPNKSELSAKYEITSEHITVEYQAPYASSWQLLALRSDVMQHNQQQTFLQGEELAVNVLPLSDYFSSENQSLDFLLTDGVTGYYLSASQNIATIKYQSSTTNIFIIILMAFIGGLILNVMPCVLPVLSFKAMSIAQGQLRTIEKWGYAIGVLVCFNLFAFGILLLKVSGESVGWGFHMQEPSVIAFLAFLFVFIALILMDVAPDGSGFAGVGQKLVNGHGFSSQFFTGVLAVIVASPCTAPFMAAALGVALVSSPLTTIAIFNALAIGFALPLSLLFISPTFASWLPKPGAWMNTFKHVLVFPMLATVAWLAWVFVGQTNPTAQFTLLLSLLGFAFFIWLSSITKGNTKALIIGLAIAIVVMTIYRSANIRYINSQQSQSSVIAFSEDRLVELKNNNQIVLINMTADWCITCKVNEHVAFSSDKLKQKFDEDSIHYMVGDWTNKNTEILMYLNKYQRSGVPLYVVYAGNQYVSVLPQILTADIVIEELNKAQKELNND